MLKNGGNPSDHATDDAVVPKILQGTFALAASPASSSLLRPRTPRADPSPIKTHFERDMLTLDRRRRISQHHQHHAQRCQHQRNSVPDAKKGLTKKQPRKTATNKGRLLLSSGGAADRQM